jgi:hypothetical protein
MGHRAKNLARRNSSLRSASKAVNDGCMGMQFFTGLHQPSDAKHFQFAFLSVIRLKDRKGPVICNDAILDSSAFSIVAKHGCFPDAPETYAKQIVHCKGLIERGGGRLLAAVSQDKMCERIICARTLDLPIEDLPKKNPAREIALREMLPDAEWAAQIIVHQIETIERYDALLECNTGVLIMPVLQGFHPDDYVRHIRMYGDRLKPGMWVGVGSVCKRNGNIRAVEDVLLTIHHERPDLRLHGFGLKTTALSSGLVQDLLHTADSMAWSFAARMIGGNGNDWREAKRWTDRIESRAVQVPLFIPEPC